MIYDIIIVGGGIAGLYTQHKLMHKYKNILLIEKDGRLGGDWEHIYDIILHEKP